MNPEPLTFIKRDKRCGGALSELEGTFHFHLYKLGKKTIRKQCAQNSYDKGTETIKAGEGGHWEKAPRSFCEHLFSTGTVWCKDRKKVRK